MTITEVKQASNGVYEITPDSGSAFFLRDIYLPQGGDASIKAQDFYSGAVFEGQAELDIMQAALVFSVEKAAMNYLARAEQCRAGLTKKLLAKNLPKDAVNQALDYLESVHYLDDARFAGAWLRNRAIDHHEGKSRLIAELRSRGVLQEAVKKAVDEYFEQTDEAEECRLALKKICRTKKDRDKIIASLIQKGFSFSTIKAVINQNENCGTLEDE